ncbi:MAG: HepT-like ribonuclease domain-containing protein [Thermoproteus sp.]
MQIHAQAAMDYLLHTCSILGKAVETPLRCVDALRREGLLEEGDARLLKKIRFRNIVVRYGAIDVEKVERILASRGYREVLRILTTLHTKLKERGAADP